MDVAELHRRACERFGDHLRQVHADQLADPTPCAEWDVRALVDHVVAEDVLGSDPVADAQTRLPAAIGRDDAPSAPR